MSFRQSPPVLTCAEAKAFEAEWFGGDETREWSAMRQAGRSVCEGILRDFNELGAFPENARVLVLVGKGHNAGDALIAAREILARYPKARIEARFVSGERALRPLAKRAWIDLAPQAAVVNRFDPRGYDVAIDGVFGFQFRPPLEPRVAELLAEANALPIRLRAAVDLPSGLDDRSAFRADFTYATGIVKTPVLDLENAGRLRFLDLGFFRNPPKPVCHLMSDKADRVLVADDVLAPLRTLRASRSDKRTFGHVFIVGGSRHYPGAVLMSVLAALRGGAGLVTAFVPESLASAFAARAPEAMWVGWPETPDGGLALEGEHLLRAKLDRADALLIGPGLGRDRETLALAKEIVARSEVPVVIDGDALQAEIVAAGGALRVLTPHAGEYARIEKVIPDGAVTIRKGPLTSVLIESARYHSFYGGPVLARGGSGDLLAGLTVAALSSTPEDAAGAACRATVWHGLAADALAREHGQVAINTTQLVDFLPEALRG